MSYKIIFAILALIFGIMAFWPYLRDVYLKRTEPHVFTWIITMITQGTAVAALWYGGGGVGALSLTGGLLLVLFVIILSLRNGQHYIAKIDIIVFLVALSAVVVWWLMDNPYLAVLIVSLIGIAAHIPTFRKTYIAPWSETAISWAYFTASNSCAIIALEEYNYLTLGYITTITAVNFTLLMFILARRKVVPKKK